MKQIMKEFGESVILVKKDGTEYPSVEMVFQGDENSFLTFDTNPPYDEGDEIRRKLPNNREEVYVIHNPQFQKGARGAIPDYYSLKISKKGQMPKGKGGNYNISINGDGARLSLHSVDNSTNQYFGASDLRIFEQMRIKIKDEIPDKATAQRILCAIDGMAEAKDKETFSQKYNEFVASAANHMTLFLPFMPTLTGLLS